MKQIGRRFSNVAAPGDQNSRHEWNIILRTQISTGSPRRIRPVADKMPAGPTARMAVLLSSRDFNFFEHVFLDCSDLFQAD